jgi:hypothetical protein
MLASASVAALRTLAMSAFARLRSAAASSGSGSAAKGRPIPKRSYRFPKCSISPPPMMIQVFPHSMQENAMGRSLLIFLIPLPVIVLLFVFWPLFKGRRKGCAWVHKYAA